METKWVVSTIILVVFILAVAGAIIFYINPFNLSGENYNFECQTIADNGEQAINLVFLSKDVSKEEVQKYADALLEVEPFSQYKTSFNFYFIDSSPECEIKSTALLCYSKKLIKYSANCPNDFIVVLSKQNAAVRSSAYMNVISLNTGLPISVLAHEFGHVFANLADEYVPARVPWGAKNCASKCENLKERLPESGCFEGCSKESYFRSSQASVMRTLSSSSYEKLNEKIISQEIEKWV